MFHSATFNPKVLKKKNIRIAGEGLEDPCYCWLTYRLLFHLSFMHARCAPNIWNKGTEVKAKGEMGQWPAKMVSSSG